MSDQTESRTFVVTTKVKQFLNDQHNARMSGDFIDALNEKVAQLLKDAVGRSDSNDRRTVRAGDL